MKKFLSAIGWLGIFIISSSVLIPAFMLSGIYLNNDFVMDGTYAMIEILDAAYAGTFSLETIEKETLILASDFVLVSMCISYIPTVIAMFLRKNVSGGYKQIEKKVLYKWITVIAAANLLLELIMILFMNLPFLTKQSDVLASVGVLSTAGNPLLALLTTGIMAPVVEEIVLRRGVQRNLCNINPVFGIISASVLFGIMHGNLFQGIFAALMGLILGYAYYKTDNLTYPTLMHITVNSSAVLCVFSGVNEYLLYALIPLVTGLFFIRITEKEKIQECLNYQVSH